MDGPGRFVFEELVSVDYILRRQNRRWTTKLNHHCKERTPAEKPGKLSILGKRIGKISPAIATRQRRFAPWTGTGKFASPILTYLSLAGAIDIHGERFLNVSCKESRLGNCEALFCRNPSGSSNYFAAGSSHRRNRVLVLSKFAE